MKKIIRILMFVLTITLFVAPVFADENPYSHEASTIGMACQNTWFDYVNPNPAVGGSALGGEQYSGFDGLTVTSIILDLCAQQGLGNPSSTDIGTIGIFDINGNLLNSFGTFNYASLPEDGTAAQDWITVSATGSYVMQSDDVIGFTFTTPNQEAVRFMKTSDTTSASIVDSYPPCGSCSSNGAIAGTFLFGSPTPPGPTPSGQASAVVGVLMALIIIALAVALFEQPELPTVVIKTAITAIVILGIIFVVFSAVGL